MLIAVEGCAHGELDKIYETVGQLERQRNVKVDLLICCGDFQSVRNEADLQCMAVPPKFRQMCSFYKYYSGEAVAPILTIFIGGNHEASNYLQELAYGGWVAPNIYYLGYAGVVKIGGIRIAGISGIYKGYNYFKGHHEIAPYDNSTMKSVYHVRNLEVYRLKQLKENIDVFMSHDWPRGVYDYGDTAELLHFKPFFRDEIANKTLGSQACEMLLQEIKPKYWFSAHLHVRFAATLRHNENQATEFLALDKCLPRRKYLELIEIAHDSTQNLELSYDPHWLAILQSTNHLLNVSTNTQYMPGPGYPKRWDFHPTEEELKNVAEIFENDFRIPLNFSPTADAFRPPFSRRPSKQADAHINPQTTQICEKLGITDPLRKLMGKSQSSFSVVTKSVDVAPVKNPDEIDLDLDDDEEEAVVGEKDLFFIDTKPQRTKLSMPKPQMEISEEPKQTDLPVVDDTVTDNSVESKVVDEVQLEEAPVVKKLKRRNQEIYTNEEDS